jgi:hypothetical protein
MVRSQVASVIKRKETEYYQTPESTSENPPVSLNSKVPKFANQDQMIRLSKVHPIQTARLWNLSLDDE